MAIVNSLFADYLGYADRRDPLLTDAMSAPMTSRPTPTVQRSVTTSTQENTTRTPTITQQPTMFGSYTKPTPTATRTYGPTLPDETGGLTRTTTQEEEIAAALEAAGVDLSGLEGLDILGGGPLNLGVAGGQTFMSMPDYLETLPQTPAEYFDYVQNYLSGLSASNFSDVNINDRDNLYNDFFGVGPSGLPAYRYEGDPADFRAEAGLSDAFAVYDNPDSQITSEDVQSAYNALTSAEDRIAFLSDYYGFDITPATNEGADYSRAGKYGSDEQRMAEFQSIVEPILQKSVAYIAATQGLNYTDALEYAYTHDPMLASLYGSYGVDLYRQTDDGSTYIFDPIAGQEIRTVEVKDANPLPAVVGLTLALTGVPAALGAALGASGTAATALGSALMSGASTLIQGGDLEDALKSGITSAITSGISGDLSEAVAATLGVSDDIAAGITAAGLSAAQGANTEEALLSGFLAGASSYIQGKLPPDAKWDADKRALVGPDGKVIGQQPGEIIVGGPDANEASAAAWSAALSGAENFAANQGGTTTETPEIFAGRTTGEATVDTTTGTGGGMLTADTPAGGIEEVVVSGDGSVQYTMPSDNGVIYQTAEELTTTPFGEEFLTAVQSVDPVGHRKILEQIEAGADSITWRNITYPVSLLMGTGTTTTQLPERVPPETGDTGVPDDSITVEDATEQDQPPLPPEDTELDIPDIDVENPPPEFDVDPEITTQTTTDPTTTVIPADTGGGGGGGGGTAGDTGDADGGLLTGGISTSGSTTGDVSQTADGEVGGTATGGAVGETTEGGGAITGGTSAGATGGAADGSQGDNGSAGGAAGGAGGAAGGIEGAAGTEGTVGGAADGSQGAESGDQVAEGTEGAADDVEGTTAEGRQGSSSTAIARNPTALLARQILQYAVMNRGEYREDYDFNNDGLVTAADALAALKAGVSSQELMGDTDTIFEDTTAQTDTDSGNILDSTVDTGTVEDTTDIEVTDTGTVGDTTDTVVTDTGTIDDTTDTVVTQDTTGTEVGDTDTVDDLGDADGGLDDALDTGTEGGLDDALDADTGDGLGDSDVEGGAQDGEDLEGDSGLGDGEGDGEGSGLGDGEGTGEGSGEGDGEGDGTGDGTGDGSGTGTGLGGLGGSGGMFSLGGGVSPIKPTPFMASIAFNPELLTPYMPKQSRDYLSELLSRLQA